MPMMSVSAVLVHQEIDNKRWYRNGLRVGGVSFAISGAREEDVALSPQLRQFQAPVITCDIDLRVEWVSDLFLRPDLRLFDSGNTWRLYQAESGFRFDIGHPLPGEKPYKRLLVDSNFCRATLQMSKAYFADFRGEIDPFEYPLDELLIMHRLTQEKAIELHGCGIVGPNGESNLFVGHSGAGKSTTTRLWMAHHPVKILSDDRVIVRAHPVRDAEGLRDN